MGVFFLSFSLSPHRTRGVTLPDERTFGKLYAAKQADSFRHRPSSLLTDKTNNKTPLEPPRQKTTDQLSELLQDATKTNALMIDMDWPSHNMVSLTSHYHQASRRRA
jgi:hypothetical protein